MKRLQRGLRSPRRRLALLLAITAFAPLAAAPPVDDASLLAALRGGGYSLYIRHVATDWSQTDRVEQRDDWLSCDATRMRQLADSGREAARAIGSAMRKLAIPVGEVLASPYCRTMETARLIDVGPVQATTEVVNLRAAHWFGGRAAIVASAQRLLARPPPAGSNRVIVAHGNVARDATPVYPDEGEAVVFEADGSGGFRFVARLKPGDWIRLAESAD